jgi:shikimate kinase
MRIFLVGYMGSGKSSIGSVVAQELGLRFVDLDKAIEERQGKDIASIFSGEGEVRFREIEKQVLHDWLKQDDYVMATGGGTPCHADNMDKMCDAGVTIYLKLNTETLFDRLKADIGNRPLLQGRVDHELFNFIHDTLLEREPYYLDAQYRVKAKDLKASELTEFIRLFELKTAETEAETENENEENA